MEKIKVNEINIAPLKGEDAPKDPPLIPGGDISAEEWEKIQREKKD